MNAASGEHPAALVVYPNAKDIHYLKHEGTDQLTYRVSAKFPASGGIGWVAFKMQEMGWHPLVKDFLNPNVQSSHVTGWTKFTDATTKPELVVYQWLGDWQNDAGDIVRNQFRYSYPKDGSPNLVEMEVLEIYIPASLVKQTLDSIQKSEQEKSKTFR